MSWRKKILIGTGCLLLFILVAVRVLSDSEPEYQGEGITEWTHRYAIALLKEDKVAQKNAEVAIREIGTNGIPSILASIAQEPDLVELPSFIRSIPLLGDSLWRARLKREMAPRAALHFFKILGPGCSSAVPALAAIIDSPPEGDVQYRAMLALVHIGDASLPYMWAYLEDHEHPYRLLARSSLAQASFDRFTNGFVIVPQIASWYMEIDADPTTKMTNWRLQAGANSTARSYLEHLNEEAILTILDHASKNSNATMREAAVYGLGYYRQKASIAFAFGDPDQWVRIAATNVYRQRRWGGKSVLPTASQ